MSPSHFDRLSVLGQSQSQLLSYEFYRSNFILHISYFLFPTGIPFKIFLILLVLFI